MTTDKAKDEANKLIIPQEKRNFPDEVYAAPIASEEEDVDFMLKNPPETDYEELG